MARRTAYAANNPYKYVDPTGELFFLAPAAPWVASAAVFAAKEVAAYALSEATNGATDILSLGRLAKKGVAAAAKAVATNKKGSEALDDVSISASWRSDPYHPNWKNVTGPKAVGADVVKNVLPANARTFSNEKAAFQHLEKFNGIDAKLASERLHQIKSAAQTSRGGADNVLFDRSGGVWDPKTREFLGSLTEGGAKR